jgi:hypothetical protein
MQSRCRCCNASSNLTFCLLNPNAESPILSLWLLRCTAPRRLLAPDRLLRCEVLAESVAAARAADAASALLLLPITNLFSGMTDSGLFCSPRLLLLLMLLCSSAAAFRPFRPHGLAHRSQNKQECVACAH